MFNGNNIEVKPTIENENNIATTNYFNINVNFLKNLNVKINMANLKDMMNEDDDTMPAPVTESEIKFNNQVFDVNSDHWNQIFEKDPTPEKLFETYLDSFENFLGTGLYLFVADVRDGKHEFMEFQYEPGNAVGEPEACLTNKDVVALQKELNANQPELMFWMNFNEWAEEMYYSNFADPTNFLPDSP